MIKFALICLVVILFSSCQMYGYYVEQEVRVMNYTSETCVVTYVWHNGKIIKAWYDPIDDVNNGLIKYRQIQADSLVATLKLIR